MASSPQHEPTMEEILASIRKIISEDSTEASSTPVAEEKSAPVASAPIEAEVLELTQEIPEEPQPMPEPIPPAPEPIRSAPLPDNDIAFATIEEPVAAPVVQYAPEPEPEPVYVPEPEPVPAPVVAPAPAPAPTPAPVAAPSAGGIFTEKTRQALDNAFANIDKAIPDDAPPQAPAPLAPLPPIDGHTIEAVFERAVRDTVDPVMNKWLADNTGVIVDRMTPIIRDWMDEHFPALLEGAVREEVARVVKARGGRH